MSELSERFCTLTCTNPEDHAKKPWACEDAAEIAGRVQAEVLAACIHATCVLCHTGEKPYLMWFGGKNWKGRYQAWVHDIKLEGRVEVQTCPANAIHSLQPAASDLEELLREERLCVLREHPGLCNGDSDNPERHALCCKYHQEIGELEKGRAIVGGKG